MKEYELSTATIQDIMNKVPQEKWCDVLSELPEYMEQMQCTLNLMKITADALGMDASALIERPETFTWVDDGKRDNTIGFDSAETGEHIGDIKFEGEK